MHVVSQFARDCDSAWLLGMRELAMASLRRRKPPAVRLDERDDRPDLHADMLRAPLDQR